MEDADQGITLPGIVFGAVGTAGQRCTSTRRLLLQKGIAADMKKRGAKHIAHHIEAGEAGDLAVCRGWKKLP